MANFDLHLLFFNGAREPLRGKRITISILNGQGKLLGTTQTDREEMTITFPLIGSPLADQFTVNASAKRHRDAGFVGLKPAGASRTLHLLLPERDARMVFRRRADWPAEWRILPIEIGGNFFTLADVAGQSAACLLNIMEAIRLLPNGDSLLRAIKPLALVPANEESRSKREQGILPDRLLVDVKPDLEPLLRTLSDVLEPANSGAHGSPREGETVVSFKENRFAEGNLQFTLFTSADRVYADIDMDLHRDRLSHGLFEFFPNTVFGTRTDPRRIYALRWMASRNSGPDQGEFSPPYVLML